MVGSAPEALQKIIRNFQTAPGREVRGLLRLWKKLRRICAEQRKQIESVFCAASLCKKHFSAGAVCPEGARSGRKGSVGKPQRVFRQTQQPPDGKSGGCFLLFTVCRDRPALCRRDLWKDRRGLFRGRGSGDRRNSCRVLRDGAVPPPVPAQKPVRDPAPDPPDSGRTRGRSSCRRTVHGRSWDKMT